MVPSPRPRTLHLAPGHWAGHMRIYHRICRSLVASGYDVTLAAHAANYDQFNDRVHFTSLGDIDKTASLNLTQRLWRNLRAYKLALSSRADVFCFYAPEFIPWAVALRHKTGRPVIFDCMEDFESYALQRAGLPNQVRRPLARVVRALIHYAAHHIDAVVVSDEGTGRLLKAEARRLLVIHNFPKVKLFAAPQRNDEQKEYDLIYHGTIPRYHLEVCFAADDVLVSRGRHLKWRFIGRLNDLDWFDRQVSLRSAKDRFSYLSTIPHDQIADEICKARVGIIPLPDRPKFHTNIPQKLFEFMALRMPVVLSDLPPSRPFVGDGKCAIMVPPADYEAYADAIIQLIDDPQLCQQMGEEGRRRVEREYNWDSEAQKLLDLYAELLGQ